MRLLTHNQLICVVKGCTDNYPLKLVPTKVETEETDCNFDFILHVLPNVEYKTLYETATTAVGIKGLPEKLPEGLSKEKHEDILKLLHTTLLDTHVQEGKLVCGKCGRSYPIQAGIPNMRLLETEV